MLLGFGMRARLERCFRQGAFGGQSRSAQGGLQRDSQIERALSSALDSRAPDGLFRRVSPYLPTCSDVSKTEGGRALLTDIVSLRFLPEAFGFSHPSAFEAADVSKDVA